MIQTKKKEVISVQFYYHYPATSYDGRMNPFNIFVPPPPPAPGSGQQGPFMPTPTPMPAPTPTPQQPSSGAMPPPPASPPPVQIPQKPGTGLPPGTFGYVPPISINQCMYRISYIWPSGGAQGFWFYPYYVDGRSAAGYIWNGFSWQPTGFDLNLIDLITCT